MPPTTTDDLDVAAVAAAYEVRARLICAGELPAPLQLRGRLAPERWRLEWHLPWWVGRSFGLDAARCFELSVSSVLGLAAVRLRDDIADAELDGADPAAAAAWSEGLLDAALETYRARVPDESEFWPFVASVLGPESPAAPVSGSVSVSDGADLARRGAPLKVPAFAVCLLADRSDAFPFLARCLDHALTALVLYDHAADWEADLAAGRANAFADGRTREELLMGLLSGDVVRPYFARIATELARAADLADALAVGRLAQHVCDLARRFALDRDALAAHYAAVGDRAAALFGATPQRPTLPEGRS